MSKPARIIFFEEMGHPPRAANSPASGCATIGDDSRGSGHSPGHYRNLNLLFRSFFRTGDSALLAQAASVPPPGRASAGLTKFVQLFRENPRRVLNVLLLGDGLVNVPLVVLCLVLLWEGPLASRIPQWVAGFVIFAIVVLLCDLIPKLLALSAPYRLSSIGAFTLQISMPLLDRVGHGLETCSAWIVDRLTPSHLRIRPRLSDEELERSWRWAKRKARCTKQKAR